MESFLNDNFEVKSKNSSEEALQTWRKVCGFVKNPKRRFRFTANLSKRYEAAEIRRCNQEKLRIAVLVSKAALQYIQDLNLTSEYAVPEEVRAAGFEICADELECVMQGCHRKLKYHGGVNGIAEKLSTSTTNGLSSDSHLLNRRQEIYGINKFSEREGRSFWVLLWEALQDKIFLIDTSCAFVFLLIGVVMEGWQEKIHDALVIVASISLVAFVTATNDYWQTLQFRNWEKEKKRLTVQVTRDGYRQELSSDDLLPGDIVHLANGDKVPADGLFVSEFSMLLGESSLTGESEPIMVNGENPFMLSGTTVQEGSCKMMVTTVGMRTQGAKLMETLSQAGDDETPLQVKLNGVAAIVGKIGQFFALVTFAVLVQGLFTRKLKGEATLWSWSQWSGYDALDIFKYFTVSFTIFVIALPEGLPMAMTLNLAFSLKRMMNYRVLFQHLVACETMGSATNICTDMTGSLTTNCMTVVKSCIGMHVMKANKNNKPSSFCSEIPDYALKLLLQSLFNNTEAEFFINKSGILEALGKPTEIALLDFGLSLGGDFQAERQASKRVSFEPFNSTKKQMKVVLKLPNGGFRVHCKGASEIVLAACDKVINSNGEIVLLNEEFINHLKVTISQFADECLRTLCLAYKELKDEFCADNSGYTCIAVIGIKDPVRPGTKESVAICRSAGITVRMVTGDNINAAKAIARECGILTENGIAIEGPDFQQKTQEELLQLIPRIQVLARASPTDKHTFVRHLRTTYNEVVAVTGGGTDDAFSLHEADVGLALGISGTEVAKQSADIVILDDKFSTVVTMVRCGRSIVMNIKKFVQFQLTVTMASLILNISSAWLTGNVPFSDVELLWFGLITDTLVAFALATEPVDTDIMAVPAVGRKGSFITNVMWRNITGQVFYQVSVIWILQSKGKAILHLDGPDSNLILDTFIFNSFIFCQVSNLINSRKIEEKNVFKGILDNYVFVTVICCIVLFEITVIEFLGTIANTSHLTLSQWFLSILTGLLGMPVAAGMKMIPL